MNTATRMLRRGAAVALVLLGVISAAALAQTTQKEDQRACAKGDAAACGRAGERNLSGEGAPRDPGRAVPLLSRACTGGHAQSCLTLAELHTWGKSGLILDLERAKMLKGIAARHYETACSDGAADSCYALGVMAEKGTGVPLDRGRAIALYEMACEATPPHEEACRRLAALRPQPNP